MQEVDTGDTKGDAKIREKLMEDFLQEYGVDGYLVSEADA